MSEQPKVYAAEYCNVQQQWLTIFKNRGVT